MLKRRFRRGICCIHFFRAQFWQLMVHLTYSLWVCSTHQCNADFPVQVWMSRLAPNFSKVLKTLMWFRSYQTYNAVLPLASGTSISSRVKPTTSSSLQLQKWHQKQNSESNFDPLGPTGYFSLIFSSVLLYQIAFQTWLRDRSWARHFTR